MNSQPAIVVSIFLGLVSLLAGCGKGSRLDRLPLHGTVTLANGEKPSGSITFLPAKGRGGPSATTGLTGGSYKFDRSNGPTAGPHDVTVKRLASRASALEAIANRKTVREAKDEWSRSVDVVDDGQFSLDFNWED